MKKILNPVTVSVLLALSLALSYSSATMARDGENGNSNNESESEDLSFPAVPAKYLRPDANPDEKAKAIKALENRVQAEERMATRPVAFNQVKVNTNKVIEMKAGENVFIPISREHPNRLLTPFKNPQVISTSLFAGKNGECGEVCVRDGVIYITTDSPSAVTAFITEKGHEDIAFSVTMVPQAIPPREVRFTLPQDVVEKLGERVASDFAMEKAQAWEQTQPYVETLRKTLREVALGHVPSGYNLRKLRYADPVPPCKQPGFTVDWSNGQLLNGFNLSVYVGVLENTSNSQLEFRNQSCGGWKTVAVTTWPLTVLAPGQKTELYVVAKNEDELPDDRVRKPLIQRQYN